MINQTSVDLRCVHPPLRRPLPHPAGRRGAAGHRGQCL